MSLNTIEKINEKDIKKVVQLDNRPNVSGGYGQAKLSAEQLKAWFDAYPAIVRQKVDDIISILSSGERSGDYIALRLERENKDGSKITLGLSLYDLIESFANGSWADYFTVQTAQATESESLIACLNGILKTIGNSDTSDETVLGRLAHLEEENKSQASEIAENAKGIASNKAYAEQNTERIVKNETDIANTAKDITQIKRRLQFVEGATLSVESNSEVAFEKITPTNAGTYATIEKIGCITVRNNNLCIADGYYELKDELDFAIKLGVLEAGEYTFYFEGDFTGAGAISCSGAYSTINPRDNITSGTEFTLSVMEREDVGVHLFSVAADSNPEEPGWDTYPRLNGTITGIMLCKASDADKSYRPFLRSDNLCKADGRYDLSAKGETYEEQMLPLDLGVLDVGTYQLQWYGDIRKLYSISIDGDVSKAVYDSSDFRNNYIIIKVLAESQVTVTLESEWYYHGFEGGSAWSGVITGIMLVKIPDAESPILDLKYEEKSGTLWKAKPTSIESRGVNLLDESEIKVAVTRTFDSTVNGAPIGIVENGYLKALRNYYWGHIYWYPFTMNLEAKNYVVSADCYVGDGQTLDCRMGVGIPELNINKTKKFTVSKHNVWERHSVTVTLNTQGAYYFMCQGDTDTSLPQGSSDVRFKNIQISEVGTTEFHPFCFAFIEIPEAVQSLEGWGLGINAAYNNHIVLRNGRVIYRQEVDELDLGDFNWRKFTNYFTTYASWSPDTWENIDLLENTSGGVTPILICSKYSALPYNEIYAGTTLGISYARTSSYGNSISVVDVAHNNIAQDEFRNVVKGVKMVYPLQNPIETDITHLFPNFSGYIDITTEAGGSVFAINKYSLPVPWTITYITKA